MSQNTVENSKTHSLKLNRPVGGVLMRAALIVLVVLAAAEFAARLPRVQRKHQVLSLGNYHYQFEIKWFQMERYVQANGGVDVIFLGSSLVNSGIDPTSVNQAWTDETGEPPLRIFNFGVEGLTIAPNSVIARLLVETYHPRVIVFGTEVRDYAANTGTETAENLLDDPWLDYRFGEFNLRGWLADHSAAYQYFLANRNWMYWDYPENHTRLVSRTDKLNLDGYDIEQRVDQDPHRPVDPNDEEDAKDLAFFADYELTDSRVDTLMDLLSLQEDGETVVLIVQMPVVPELYGFFKGGRAVEEEYLEVVTTRTAEAGGYFMPAIDLDLIPENGWSDRVHLSKFGAPVLSRYIGEWLAELHTRHGVSLRQEDRP